MGTKLQYSSGRVIGIGRLLLATLYLLAIIFDASQPARAAVATYALLAGYLAFAAVTVVVTWSDWWLDAKVAGAAHAIDIVFFTLLMMMTAGYTSPYFTFFMFVLLSAAIRWGWRATALTAVLLVLLYLAAGLAVARSSPGVDLQLLAVRTGHLVILSLILIWFGSSRWRPHLHTRRSELVGPPSLDHSPLETSLRTVMSGLHADSGAFLWRKSDRNKVLGVAVRNGEAADVILPARALTQALASSAFLYDIGGNRALRRDAARNLVEFEISDVIAPQTVSLLALSQGLAIPVRSGGGEGAMFLESVRGLSTDYVDFAEELAASIAAHVQGHALLKAAEEGAEARSRLTLARDLHDGVVQFLAGAAFRLEAIKRAEGSGRVLAPELDELKQLMLQEQRELRSFITALRSGPLVGFSDLAKDLQSLADRLSRQWDVECLFSARAADMLIPIRLHLDAHQLMREAVANAVRHAAAKSITVTLAAEADELRLDFINDGAAFPLVGGRPELPASLNERVEQAGGTLDMSRGMGVTKFSISLPISAGRK